MIYGQRRLMARLAFFLGGREVVIRLARQQILAGLFRGLVEGCIGSATRGTNTLANYNHVYKVNTLR